ncbi:MAG: hypothetical protein ACSHX7_00580 [Luteolibacter sp.]
MKLKLRPSLLLLLAFVLSVSALLVGIHKFATTDSLEQAVEEMRAKSDLTLKKKNSRVRKIVPLDSTNAIESPRFEPSDTAQTEPAIQDDNTEYTEQVFVAYQSSRAKLMRKHEELMSRLTDANPEEHLEAMEKWQEENAEAIALHRQRAIEMAGGSSSDFLDQ